MNFRDFWYPCLIALCFCCASFASTSECHRVSWNPPRSTLKPKDLEVKTLDSLREQVRHFRQEAQLREGVFSTEVGSFMEYLPAMNESEYWSVFSILLKNYRYLRKQTSVLNRGIPARRLADLIIATWAERYLFQAHPGRSGMQIYAEYWRKVQSLGLGNDVVFSVGQAQELFKRIQLWVQDLDERGGGRNLQHSLIIYGSSVNARLHSKSDIDAALFYRGKFGSSKKWRSIDEAIPWLQLLEAIGLDYGLARMFDIRASTNDRFENPDQVIKFGLKVHPVVIEIRADRVILHRRGARHEL